MIQLTSKNLFEEPQEPMGVHGDDCKIVKAEVWLWDAPTNTNLAHPPGFLFRVGCLSPYQ